MDQENAKELRESAGFLADRGALVETTTIAERLGVTLEEFDRIMGDATAVLSILDVA